MRFAARSAPGEPAGADGAWREAFAEPSIRRLEVAWFLSLVSTFSYTVAVLVYAYTEGGAALVAVYGVASTAPGAVLTPVLMSLGAEAGSDRVLRHTTTVRAALVAGAGLSAMVDLSPILVVTFTAAAGSLGSTFRPTQAALLPWLARTPGELTTATVAATVAENAAALTGPLLAGALLAVSDPATTMSCSAACMLVAALVLRGLRVPHAAPAVRSSVSLGALVRDAGQGARALARIAPPAGIVVLALTQTFVRGALLVLMVVLALDTLSLGEDSVGWLNAAMGLGGLAGGVAAAKAVRLSRLGRCFTAGLFLWAAGVLALAGAPGAVAAVAALALVGIGNALEDASAFVLLPRLLGPRLAGPALGVFELVVLVGMGSGALAAPALGDWLGVRGALAVLGASLSVLAVLYVVTFLRVDRAVTQEGAAVGVLRAVPLFRPLPVVVVEQLASALQEHRFAAGETITAEGEVGDRFHIVTAGEAAVDVGGARRRSLHAGDGFGEIALLRDVPRTATVTALSDVTTLSLERPVFLDALSMSPASRHLAESLAERRLAGDLHDDLPGGAPPPRP